MHFVQTSAVVPKIYAHYHDRYNDHQHKENSCMFEPLGNHGLTLLVTLVKKLPFHFETIQFMLFLLNLRLGLGLELVLLLDVFQEVQLLVDQSHLCDTFSQFFFQFLFLIACFLRQILKSLNYAGRFLAVCSYHPVGVVKQLFLWHEVQLFLIY